MLNEKLICDSMHNSEKFKVCSPEEQLMALVYGIVNNGQIKQSNLDIWNERKPLYNQSIDAAIKINSLKHIVCSSHASRDLKALIDHGIFEFCMKEYFPLSRISKRDLADISKNISLSSNDPNIRIAIILFPFGYAKAEAIFNKCTLKGVDKDKILFAIKHFDEYLMIKQPHLLKNFIYAFGWDNFTFMDLFSSEIIKVIDIPEYKHKTKTFLLEEIERRGEPIFVEDMEINRADLIELGVGSDDVEEILADILHHLHKYPKDNKKEILKSMANKMNKSILYRFCIKKGILKMK